MIDFIASMPHYAAHLRPVWESLPRWARGSFGDAADAPLAVVGSASDYAKVKRRYPRVALMEHGTGQSYGGDPRSATHPSYAGGRGYADLAVIFAPNVFSALRWSRAYPAVPVVVIGGTYRLPDPSGPPCLAVAFHWDAPVCPESRSAWRHYRRSLPRLAAEMPLIGHAHPRAPSVARQMRRMGIEVVDDLEEVARRATVFAVDNSSTLYEMALSRPVIALDAPWYRRDVSHGLRFWDLIPGPRVADGERLAAVARDLLHSEPDDERTRRVETARAVIPYDDGAERAARWLVGWLGL